MDMVSGLQGRLMLEAGCGAGTFTEFAVATKATVLSFDLSEGGVRANYRKNGHHKNLLIVQADIFNIPAKHDFFDHIYCFGVLQHTPDPKAAFLNLCHYLKTGRGRIATDIYTMPPANHPYEPLWKSKYRMRSLMKGVSDKNIFRFVVLYVNILWPLTRVILKLFPKNGVHYNRFLLFDDYPPRLPGMDPRKYKAFAKLDIHDFLAPDYDAPATESEYKSWHVEAELKEIDVHPGYNGLEGRGIRG
jgi:SAM-dependent methyltransferase